MNALHIVVVVVVVVVVENHKIGAIAGAQPSQKIIQTSKLLI